MARKRKPQPDPVIPAESAVDPAEARTPPADEPRPTHDPRTPGEPTGEPAHADALRADGPRVPNPFGFRQDAVTGVRLLEDRRFKQMQLRFAAKPSDEVRAAVAEAGWKWRPQEEHWTRQIHPAKGWQTRADADALFQQVVTMIRAEMGVAAERG